MRERGCVCRRYAGCGGEWGSAPPGFGCPSRGGWGGACVRVCVCVYVCVPPHSLTPPALLYLEIFFRGGGGLTGHPFQSFTTPRRHLLQHEPGGKKKNKPNPNLKILGSPSPPPAKQSSSLPRVGWGGPPLPRIHPPMVGGRIPAALRRAFPRLSISPPPQCHFPHSRNFLAPSNFATAAPAFKGPSASSSVWRAVSQPRLQR